MQHMQGSTQIKRRQQRGQQSPAIGANAMATKSKIGNGDGGGPGSGSPQTIGLGASGQQQYST